MPRHGRAALLRLAGWFEEAGADRADDLARAAYALHPALHVEGRVDESIAATTGWWQAEADRSAVVEHPGTRPPAPVRDHRAQQARLRDAAESSAHWRRAGASQIRALLTEPTGDRAHVDLSGAGMEVLMELLTAALGAGDAARSSTSAGDLEFSLRLHVVSAPGAEVTVQGEGGDLTLEGVRLCVTPYEQHVLDLSGSAEPGDGAAFGFGRPRGASAAEAPAPAVTPGSDEPETPETPETPVPSAPAASSDATAPSDADGSAGSRADVLVGTRDDDLLGSASGALSDEDPLGPASDVPADDDRLGPASDVPGDDDLLGPASGAPADDDLLGSAPGAPAEDDLLGPVSEASAEDDLLGSASEAPAEPAGGGFAELAGAVAEALALARAEEESESEPRSAHQPELRAARPGDETAEGPDEDPASTDSLAEPDRDRHPDPNTETTGPIDLSAIRDGERSAWG
ncbi:uncharacterized protein DUF2397 [Nocardiopsis sp. Huas11]|nr:uncharacterized protein DUF2397 [Nocardiopsis sp. Huas11]